MSLLTFNADLSSLVVEMRRIADALDRAIPPVPSRPAVRPRPATLADLHVTDNYNSPVASALAQFAYREGLSLNSDLFIQRMMEYEGFLRAEFGEDSIDSLPWNKDGRLFTQRQDDSTAGEDGVEGGEASKDAESTATSTSKGQSEARR